MIWPITGRHVIKQPILRNKVMRTHSNKTDAWDIWTAMKPQRGKIATSSGPGTGSSQRGHDRSRFAPNQGPVLLSSRFSAKKATFSSTRSKKQLIFGRSKTHACDQGWAQNIKPCLYELSLCWLRAVMAGKHFLVRLTLHTFLRGIGESLRHLSSHLGAHLIALNQRKHFPHELCTFEMAITQRHGINEELANGNVRPGVTNPRLASQMRFFAKFVKFCTNFWYAKFCNNFSPWKSGFNVHTHCMEVCKFAMFQKHWEVCPWF